MNNGRINGIICTAPLFRGATEEQLLDIVELLSRASYHFADDSAKEWTEARSCLLHAAEDIINLGLDFEAIEALYKHKHQLCSFAQLMNTLMRRYRNKIETLEEAVK